MWLHAILPPGVMSFYPSHVKSMDMTPWLKNALGCTPPPGVVPGLYHMRKLASQDPHGYFHIHTLYSLLATRLKSR